MRLPDYDYRQSGVYFVTVCTHQHVSLFGNITDGDIVLNELGKVVNSEWLHVAQARTNVLLDNYVIMPNHLHGIVIIDNENYRTGSKFEPETMANARSSYDPARWARLSDTLRPQSVDGPRLWDWIAARHYGSAITTSTLFETRNHSTKYASTP